MLTTHPPFLPRPTFIRALTVCVSVWLLAAANGFAQSNTNPDSTEIETFTVVEQPPEFAGGRSALRDYLRKNLHYPPAAQAAKVSGRVFTSFVVQSNGRITDVQILQGIGFGCDEGARRIVSAMPNWQPGRQAGRAVRVKYNLPISFKP